MFLTCKYNDQTLQGKVEKTNLSRINPQCKFYFNVHTNFINNYIIVF